jgi:hypothetical protein
MRIFGIDFVMEPLMGHQSNNSERVPHNFVVMMERDD